MRNVGQVRQKQRNHKKNIALSGYVTDIDSSFDGLEMISDVVNQGADLNWMEEKADSRFILHFANARAEGFKNFPVLSNDSDVVSTIQLI